eukprot:7382525-Prymnesium_polylepis.2
MQNERAVSLRSLALVLDLGRGCVVKVGLFRFVKFTPRFLPVFCSEVALVHPLGEAVGCHVRHLRLKSCCCETVFIIVCMSSVWLVATRGDDSVKFSSECTSTRAGLVCTSWMGCTVSTSNLARFLAPMPSRWHNLQWCGKILTFGESLPSVFGPSHGLKRVALTPNC